VCIEKFLLTPRLDQEPNDIESSHRDISRRVGRSSWCAHHQLASRATAFYYRAVERFFAWCDGRPRRRSHSRRGGEVIALLAVPILIQVYFNAGLAYWLNRRLGVEWCVGGPSALIGASNFFELAVATAIALFGFQSGAALSTVVGVSVEVPVMLSVVHLVRRSREWYERAAQPS
jgi:hypothetical protein